ncbi:Nudix hydrolase 12, mitochondrial [Vitis vinifera]|uniref:Nudix hydrolase 12, mitochondrial n=1 Tax=Vitis vinifera TaxID=29760 RepID=A0A438EB08_VITVI|nr:Nudix hydrolase 12, mitochondrial [Vitis vinifera]
MYSYRQTKNHEDHSTDLEKTIEVLMISSPNRNDLVFPKGGWEDDETVEEAACREALEEAGVKGILNLLNWLECETFLVMDECVELQGTFEWNCLLLPLQSLKALLDFLLLLPIWLPQFSLFMEVSFEKSLGVWEFRSKSRQENCCLEGGCRGYMFALKVTEELETWPEKENHDRKWLSINEAFELCRYEWMRRALEAFLQVMEEDRELERREEVYSQTQHQSSFQMLWQSVQSCQPIAISLPVANTVAYAP